MSKREIILSLDTLNSDAILLVLPHGRIYTQDLGERINGDTIMRAEDKTIGNTNPVKQYRHYLGLSINELELRSGVHRQVIIRAEQGCFNVIPPRLYTFLVGILGEGQPSLADNYKHWIHQKRISSYGTLPNALPPFNPTKHPFVLWRESGRNEFGRPLNRTEICKLFCVHPSTLTRFETNLMMQTIPEQLREALLQSGYKSELIDELSIQYKRYRIYQLNRPYSAA